MGRPRERLHRKRVLFATGTSGRSRGNSRDHTGGRARSPSLAKSVSAKSDSAKRDSAKSDCAKSDSAKSDSAKGDCAKSDSAKIDSADDAPPTKRARSASEEPKQPEEPQQPEEGKEPQRRRRRGWDALPDVAEVIMQQRIIPGMFPKKRRECFCGNLLAGQVDCQMLRSMFRRLFNALPAFHECYPDVADPVRNVEFPQGQGKFAFAFVEFFDEVIASTAVLMSGFELSGRPVKVGRPQGYVPASYGELAPLDVDPLRRCGFVPMQPDIVTPSVRSSPCGKLRELYFGNLSTGRVTEALMTELLTPACIELPEYDPMHGPPITKVQMAINGQYCFVEFQNSEMASRLIAVFDDTKFFGRKLRVGRPASYALTLQQVTPALSAPPSAPALRPMPPMPPVPPPPPVVDSEAVRAGAVAAASIPTRL